MLYHLVNAVKSFLVFSQDVRLKWCGQSRIAAKCLGPTLSRGGMQITVTQKPWNNVVHSSYPKTFVLKTSVEPSSTLCLKISKGCKGTSWKQSPFPEQCQALRRFRRFRPITRLNVVWTAKQKICTKLWFGNTNDWGSYQVHIVEGIISFCCRIDHWKMW